LEAERAALRQARKALESAAEKVLRSQDELLRNSEHQLIDLVVEVSRKVLMQEIKAGQHDIEPIVTEALKRIPSRKDVIVHLNPEDLEGCRMAQETEQTDGARNVRFVPDPGVPRAECALETVEGVVDSSIEAQLERVGAALKGPE
jgi:flagellar assembly protein FliH